MRIACDAAMCLQRRQRPMESGLPVSVLRADLANNPAKGMTSDLIN
jgi:hypothetical protein